VDVRVVTRPGGPSDERARADGFAPSTPGSLGDCDVIAVLVPDEVAVEVLRAHIHPHAPQGALLVFAHGFALRRPGGLPVREDLDVALVGPLGPGALLRERFERGQGLAGLFAVVRDATGSGAGRALAYAAALRLTRAGLLVTTLEEEVVSDLFAEQAVLTGGVVQLMRAAWETLVEGGVSEEVAYYSCVQELKQILDLVHAEGIAGMRARTSRTAQYGGLTRGPRILGEDARAEMRRVLEEIRGGAFGEEWLREAGGGGAALADLVAREAGHPIEGAGERVRRRLGGP
jgi:ketol-acid reductoisomerase